MFSVGIDVSQSAYSGTGSGRYVIELVSALLRDQSTVDYVLFGGALQQKEQLRLLGEKYRQLASHVQFSEKYIPLPPKFFEIVWNKLHVLPIELFTGEIDVYHSSDWTQAPSQAKKVTTVHDMIPFLFPEYVHPRILLAHTQRWKWIVHDTVCIIVDAESTKRDILEHFPNIAQERIRVIPLGCSEQFLQIGEQRFSGEQKLSENTRVSPDLSLYGIGSKKYILSVGTLEPRKNIARLIEAYSRLDRELREEYALVIVGKKAWSSQFSSVDGVHFTGYVSDTDLPYVYAGASCFAMPSLYEGFGIPVLEAMACGVPVVCSDRSSLPEVGGNDVHYIQDPENVESIRMILAHVLSSDPEELERVARCAYYRAREFSWTATARKTVEVYRTL